MISVIEFIIIVFTICILAFLSVFNVRLEVKDTMFTKYYIFKYWRVMDYHAKEIILWKQKKR